MAPVLASTALFIHFDADTDTNPVSKNADLDSEPQRWKKSKKALFPHMLHVTNASFNL